MAINLEDKLFHSIVVHEEIGSLRKPKLETELLKLKRIFLSQKIMCRQSIQEHYEDIPYEVYFSRRNYNGDEFISLAKHITQKNEEDLDERYVLCNKENAWQMYPFSHISLVLKQDLLQENLKYPYGPRIALEVQVKGDIDLKYLEAISFPGDTELIPFFSRKKVSLERYLEQFYYYGAESYIELKEILLLMKKYNINVPLVSISTGEEYQENIEYDKKVRELLKQKNSCMKTQYCVK